VAGLPFFIVTALALFISFLALHFTQYASIRYPPLFYFELLYPLYTLNEVKTQNFKGKSKNQKLQVTEEGERIQKLKVKRQN
jgi:hypothetical protein